MAETMFGDARLHSHEIAKLVGSPPGYLGHRETHPVLTHEALNQWHTEKLKLSILSCFLTKSRRSDALWQLLLGILDKATLTLGDNRRVDLSQCITPLPVCVGADCSSFVHLRTSTFLSQILSQLGGAGIRVF